MGGSIRAVSDTWLKDDRLIEVVDGYYGFDDSEGQETRIRASQSLLVHARRYFPLSCWMFSDDQRFQCLELRDVELKERGKGKKPEKVKFRIGWTDTPATIHMRANLEIINGAIQETYVNLMVDDATYKKIEWIEAKRRRREAAADGRRFRYYSYYREVDLFNKKLRRIFNNGSFESGGRFYGPWWLMIPKEYRKFIRINGSMDQPP